jgi:Tfp pilus assembly protein PilO
MAAIEWSERKKMLVTASIGLLINACAGYYLYSLNQDLGTKEANYKKVRGEIDALQKEVQEGSIKEITLSKRKAEFQAKESKLPDSERRGDLINDVSRLAAKWKCDQVSIVFQEGVADPNKNYVKDVWHTRWKANFWDWCRLMNEMEERFTRFVAFENMVFTINNNGMIPTGTRHEISVDIITYRYGKKPLGGG